MAESWTLPELVAEVASRLAALPAPSNGQVRAVPDERTIRYYATLGLLDRPAAMRGRTALYDRRHLAQVIAVKRLQANGHSLAEIQELWSTLDDATLGRMSGITVPARPAMIARPEFWKQVPQQGYGPEVEAQEESPSYAVLDEGVAVAPLELRIEITPTITISIALSDDFAMPQPVDVRAIRAAAAPLVAELAKCRLGSH